MRRLVTIYNDYFGLREALETLLPRPVDLLSIDALDNPYFIERIANERQILESVESGAVY